MSDDLKKIAGPALMIVGSALTGGAYAALGYALIAGGAVVSRDAAKDAQAEAKRRAREQSNSRSVKANVRGSMEVHYLCFGRVRVGGIVCALGTKQGDNHILHIGIAHSICHSGGCEDVGDIWVNDDRIREADISGDPLTGDAYINTSRFLDGSERLFQFRHYRGTGTQAADTTLINDNIVGGRNSGYYRRGIAWTRFTLTRPEDFEKFEEAFPSGLPNITVDLKANRCYDPRADSTNGGSGTQRHGDETSWVWSQNSAVIAATYMIMAKSDGGMGLSPSRIDWPSVAAAANICDETITNDNGSPTVSQARYTCNIALDTSESRAANLQKILDTMMGVRVRVGSKYKIHAGAYSAPAFDFDASYLRGSVKVSTRSPVERLYNAVRVAYDDADQNYRPAETPPFTSAAYEAQDGGERLWLEETRPGITNSYQAQYVGTVLGQMSRQQKIIEAPCNFKALDFETWQVGRITLDELGLDAATYRLIGFDWETGGPRLTFREETSDVWDVAEYHTGSNEASAPLVRETPPALTGFAATAAAGGILLSWDSPAPPGTPFVEIWRASGSGSPQVFSKIKTESGFSYWDEPSDSTTYHYKARRRSRSGEVGTFTPEVTAATGSLKVSGSGARLGDERNATALLSLNRQPAVQTGANPLTAADVGATADINIASHTVQTAAGTITYGAGSISGAGFSTVYYVYANDPTFAGTNVYAATLTFSTITASSGRYYIGTITTPANGAGGTSGSGGGQFEP